MRKMLPGIGQLLSLLSVLFIFPSCAKINDSLPGGHGGSDDFKPCNIKTITHTVTPPDAGPMESTVYTFNYNALGHPTSIVPNKQDANFIYTVKFTYDNRQRLTSYYGVYNAEGPEQDFFDLHTFSYDAKNRITKEKFYYGSGKFSEVKNGSKPAMSYQSYEYDSKDRISKVSTINYPNTTAQSERIDTYQYDHHGNLIRPGVTYDNKFNIARTNTIWMFIKKDYSVNNAFTAETYNYYGFPTRINETNSIDFQLIPSVFIQFSNVEYKCD